MNKNVNLEYKKETIKIMELINFCTAVFVKEGMELEDAKKCATVLAETDAFGVHSHGTRNLFNYVKKKNAGGVSFTTRPEIVKQGEAYAVIDGHNSMGMISSWQAVDIACDKATKCGIAFVTIRNSCHFGAAGFYSNLAAKRKMIGISVSNVDPNMTAPGAKGKVIGNNPIAFSSPMLEQDSMFLDISCSNVASLKVIEAKRENRKIPTTWIIDDDGKPTDDPSEYPNKGAMQPMGFHKGYGLSILVELLTGVLSSGENSTNGNIVSWCFEPEKPNNVSHAFIVIDPSKFLEEGILEERMQRISSTLRNSPKASGTNRIYTPGEIDWEKYHEAEQNGIKLPSDVFESLRVLSNNLDIQFPETYMINE